MSAPDGKDEVMLETDGARLTILPPAPHLCQTCAVDHEPSQPHNPQSLYWATVCRMEGKPEPTWAQAMEHCEPEVKEAWTAELAKHGVTV